MICCKYHNSLNFLFKFFLLVHYRKRIQAKSRIMARISRRREYDGGPAITHGGHENKKKLDIDDRICAGLLRCKDGGRLFKNIKVSKMNYIPNILRWHSSVINSSFPSQRSCGWESLWQGKRYQNVLYDL